MPSFVKYQSLRRCAAPTFLIILIFSSAFARATTARTVTLQEALDLAHKGNLSFLASLSKIDKAKALEDQALAARYPKIIGTGLAAPVYKITGDAISSQSDINTWGAWLTATITVLQPIYTWGKLSSLREAARRNIDVQTAEVSNDRNQTDFEVKELYYGSILVEQLFNFLDDGKRDLEEVQKKTDEDQTRKHPRTPKRDVYRLKIFKAEADYRWFEAKKMRDLAHHALAFRLGLDPNEEILPAETDLIAVEGAPPSEERLLERLNERRPELSQLRNGILAKEALLSAEKANKLPMFFLGGMITLAHSNARTPQGSAFASDPYNRTTGGIGAGAQWNFDFKTTLANEGAIRAEIIELERKQNYALAGFRLELRKSLADLSEARERLETSRGAFDIGRKWLISESMNYTVGLTEVKDLIDAYLARAKTAKDMWDALYRVNMAWAQLTKTIGIEVTPGLSGPATN